MPSKPLTSPNCSKLHREADERYRVRLDLEQNVQKLQEIEAEQSLKKNELVQLLADRKTLKAKFLLEREQVSELRDSVATELQRETGRKVRIRVLRNADNLAYRTLLTEGLKGARVRNHDEILDSLLQLRPEQLAQFIQTDDQVAFDEACGFGVERTRKILDAFRENVDPLELEVVDIEDQVRIELNVATINEPIFKDAAELSRGQKCTALLPLLLARTDNPLIIDQPEDNLDNHFIYETVVNSIQRLKGKRQMIFITHNANIPVLADAELVIVMNSDGKDRVRREVRICGRVPRRNCRSSRRGERGVRTAPRTICPRLSICMSVFAGSRSRTPARQESSSWRHSRRSRRVWLTFLLGYESPTRDGCGRSLPTPCGRIRKRPELSPNCFNGAKQRLMSSPAGRSTARLSMWTRRRFAKTRLYRRLSPQASWWTCTAMSPIGFAIACATLCLPRKRKPAGLTA